MLPIYRALRKGVPDKAFMSKFLGISFLTSASQQGRAWEHGPGTLCKLLSSHSFSERLECSEKAFHVEVPWGVLSVFRRQQGTYLAKQGTNKGKPLF